MSHFFTFLSYSLTFIYLSLLKLQNVLLLTITKSLLLYRRVSVHIVKKYLEINSFQSFYRLFLCTEIVSTR